MKRIVVAGVALFAAVLIQLTVVNGLPFPGGGTPDLVLLCVVALGLTGGTQAGLIAGFFAGLALDLAPPAWQMPKAKTQASKAFGTPGIGPISGLPSGV